MKSRIGCSGLVSFLMLSSLAANAQQSHPQVEAVDQYQRALELQRSGRHREAAAAFAQAYRDKRQRELVYVIIGHSPDGSATPLLETLSRVLDGTANVAPSASSVSPSADQASASIVESPSADEPDPSPQQVQEDDEANAVAEASESENIVAVAEPTLRNETIQDPREQTEDADHTEPGHRIGALAWTLGGLGAAALLGGGITGLLALDAESELSARCTAGLCPPEDSERLSRANSLGRTSTILLVSGGTAMLASVLVGWLWPQRDADDPSMSAMCTGDGCTASLLRSF